MEDDVHQALERSFYLPFAVPVPAERLKASTGRQLLTYVQGYGHELARTLPTESPFEVPLAGARFRVRIDLVLRTPTGRQGEVELIDSKAAAERPPRSCM